MPNQPSNHETHSSDRTLTDGLGNPTVIKILQKVIKNESKIKQKETVQYPWGNVVKT